MKQAMWMRTVILIVAFGCALVFGFAGAVSASTADPSPGAAGAR